MKDGSHNEGNKVPCPRNLSHIEFNRTELHTNDSFHSEILSDYTLRPTNHLHNPSFIKKTPYRNYCTCTQRKRLKTYATTKERM